MISLVETRFALRGLLRILRFDSGFLKFYDLSRAGALRSFSLALPLLVTFLAELYLQHGPYQAPLTWRLSAAMVIAYVINWLYFPLFLLSIARFINREVRVIGCITVYNWLGLLSLFTTLPLSLLAWVGMEAGFLEVLDFVGLAIALVCEGYVFAVCLQIPGFFAAGFVALELILNHLLFTLADRLGAGPLF